MRVQAFLIFVVLNVQISATSYRRGEDLDADEVELLFQQDTPSQINCANQCALKKGDFVFNQGRCTCFAYFKDNTRKSGIHPNTLIGTFYEKENVCLIGNGGCHPDAQCTNNIGTSGVSCTCNPGYIGNGLSCTDVNECLINNGDCDENANCINTMGSRTCICKKGYRRNGSTCLDIDECLTNNGDCDANAKCINTIGSRNCICNYGYEGNGLTCTMRAKCPMMNTYMGGDRITYIKDMKSWQQCGRTCADTPSCIMWTWYTPSWRSSDREQCRVYSSYTYSQTRNDIISGVRGCGM